MSKSALRARLHYDVTLFNMYFFFIFYSGLFAGLNFIGSSESGGWQIFVGILMLVTALGFGTVALADFFLLVRVRLKIISSDENYSRF